MGLQVGVECHGRQRTQGRLGLVAAVKGLHAGDLQLVLLGLVQVVAIEPGDVHRLLGRPDDFAHGEGDI